MKRAPGTEIPKAGARILFVTPVTPSFSGNGLAMRAAHLVEALAGMGFVLRLAIIPIFDLREVRQDKKVEALCQSVLRIPRPKKNSWEKRCERLRKFLRLKSDPLRGDQIFLFWIREIEKALGPEPADLLFAFRLSTLFFLSRRRLRSSPLWLDLDEVDSAAMLRAAKMAEADGNRGSYAQGCRKSQAYLKLERRFLPLPQHLSVSSEIERDRLPDAWRKKTLILPNIVRDREMLPPRGPHPGPFRLLFVGSFGHPPNVDAVSYFCREILAGIEKQLERPIEFTVVGMDPRGDLVPFRDLKHVRILGGVENLDSIYAETDLAVVPLRTGAGTRIKILEAFSYGRCVVSTSIGAEGLKVKSGMELMLADSPPEFARACAALLVDPQRREALAKKGHACYRQEHSPMALRRLFEKRMNDERNEAGSDS